MFFLRWTAQFFFIDTERKRKSSWCTLDENEAERVTQILSSAFRSPTPPPTPHKLHYHKLKQCWNKRLACSILVGYGSGGCAPVLMIMLIFFKAQSIWKIKSADVFIWPCFIFLTNFLFSFLTLAFPLESESYLHIEILRAQSSK